MLLNCGVAWESLGQQGDQTSQSKRKSTLKIHWRTDAEAEAPILWPPDAKHWLTEKYPDAGKDWRQEKGMTEDEMVGWCQRLDEHEFEQTLGDGEGQGSLACCSPWGRKESYVTEWLNNSNSKRLISGAQVCFLSIGFRFILDSVYNCSAIRPLYIRLLHREVAER